MLKSTYKPSAAALQPLPPGWTEHKAPTGHTYYYNAETKESTYKRPTAALPPAPLAAPLPVPQINLSDPNVANAFMSQYAAAAAPPPQSGRGGFGGAPGRGGFQPRPRPQPIDKPRSKVAIPGCEPWILVYTKYGRRFAYNPTKNASYWRIPEKLMPAILELDQARIRQKAAGADKTTNDEPKDSNDEPKEATVAPRPGTAPPKKEHDYDSSEYEEVEVTDDEDENEDGSAPKRQRTEEPGADGPVEFTEADIAAQLAAMGAEYGDDDDEEMGDYDEHEPETAPLSDHDARELFKDMLDDYRISPYSPWEKLIEEGKVFDDPRYTVLTTMRARREVWEEWSRARLQALKDQRAKQEGRDPRIAYLAFLQEKATPKLYWPEFRRKYKREDAMRDPKLPDKDRERWYREHINRLKLPASTLKTDLKKLLESVPPAQLNRDTQLQNLPAQVLTDIRYISLDPQVRDPFVEGYIQGLPPAPTGEDGAKEEETEATRKARDERRKRERALEERERAVAEEKRRLERRVQIERARLREEERELERAMVVGKRGLQSQLVGAAEGKVVSGSGSGSGGEMNKTDKTDKEEEE
ncbi:hypothetical protein QBC47DRAFT_373370 [Echria macrotheca]|uniref:WW domain-containing protein n=1 Tax=Echria macrotheca TaxID=438768 RepID=A0AAJ0BL51_9PEZI|nr:hypothetical protein QBC47DRAFT_373370 [Echria macrotheca]